MKNFTADKNKILLTLLLLMLTKTDKITFKPNRKKKHAFTKKNIFPHTIQKNSTNFVLWGIAFIPLVP